MKVRTEFHLCGRRCYFVVEELSPLIGPEPLLFIEGQNPISHEGVIRLKPEIEKLIGVMRTNEKIKLR